MTIQSLAAYPLPTAEELPTGRVNWPFEPGRAVLLVHDMQHYFVDFYGPDNSLINQVIDHIATLIRQARALGMPVVYTAQPAEQSQADRALLNDMWGPGLTRAPERQPIVPALAPEPQDTVLTKWRYSAFCRSPLAELMAEWGRDQLVICGIYGHIGVMQTAVDAFMRDIRPFLVADAIADFSREDHLLALSYVSRNAGRVITVAEVMAVASKRPLTRELLRAQVLARLPAEMQHEQPTEDDNLLDYGLDSLAVMGLVEEWHQQGLVVELAELARNPTLAHWWGLLSRQLNVSQDTAHQVNEDHVSEPECTP
ncbi:isochorismatase [Aeromonas sp. HMWF036]|uniref:isochorismatase family protein n=1 Tax=unclassified Aeromonas TaxID=257493 RepID=UPI000D37DD9A|nr:MULTISPECIES: isochorismatase family protein [unclassified Aeromonas]PTS75824.1 isochorismatase [Aeromonas sp. HMWF036]PTT30570.1 isochorismatase [Aeromonas sp. HMWF017]